MTPIARRRFLKRGAALSLGLQSLALRGAEPPMPAQPPRRTVFICNSLGFHEPYFFPGTRGDLSSSRYLAPMRTREKMTVFQNLFHPGMDTSNHDSEKSFLTGAPHPEAVNFTNTVSLDQLLAESLGDAVRFPFLPLSIYDRGWGCSWNRRGVAIPPLHDERQIFEKLFGEEDLSARHRQITRDREVVRCLHRDLAHLQRHGADGSKIDSYRTVIAELEARLRREEFWLNTSKPEVPDTLSRDREFPFSTKIRNLLELAKLALRTDSTRVITFSMDWIYGAIKVPGATGGWHTLSHHGGRAETIARLSCIETEILGQLDRFLHDLDQIPEGRGTLLDHTTVVIGSNFGNSSNHTCRNLPIIVAGGGYRHQGHTVLEKPTPLCNLYLELLRRHGIDAPRFGSSESGSELLPG